MKPAKPTFLLLLILIAGNAFLVAADHWANVGPLKKIVFLWMLVGISDCIAAGVSVAHAWRSRSSNSFARYLTMLLGAIAIETVCVLTANIDAPVCKFTLWYSCWAWSGRWAKSFAVWMMVLYQLGAINGVRKRA